MSRTTPARPSSRFPRGLAGMIALVLLVEGTIEGRALELFDVDEWAYRWTARAASGRAAGAQILCFGDSLVRLGVVPSVVRERTGRRTFNLALSGGQAPASYCLLGKALASGARPEAVVVNFAPPLLRVGPRHNLTRWGALLDPIEIAELARWSRDAPLFAEVALGRALPSLRGRDPIRRNLGAILARRSPADAANNPMGLRNWDRNDGAQAMVGFGARDAPVAQIRGISEGAYPDWRCHPANLEAIDRFLALASANRVRVFWLLPPMVPALHVELNRRGIEASHEEFLRSWQAKYPDLVILDARGKVAEVDAFWDPQHLSVVGASAFSTTLGDVLRRSMDGKPRRAWVAFPDVKIGPVSPGIEDIEQSRLAIKAGKARR